MNQAGKGDEIDMSDISLKPQKGKTPWENMSPEQQTKRIGRLSQLHEQVIETTLSNFVGEGFSDGSGSSVFLSFGKDWGVLWYNNPDKARKIHSHYVFCTDVLREANHNGLMHPIFEPVWMHPENSRPYLVRAMPGDTFDNFFHDLRSREKLIYKNFFWKILNPYLKEIIGNLNFTDEKKQFDLKSENLLINPLLRDILQEQSTLNQLRSILKQRGENRQESFISLLSEWYEQGARIYLFDYGTWIKPDGTDKYGKMEKNGDGNLPSYE